MLESIGIVESEYVRNPGHGRRRYVYVNIGGLLSGLLGRELIFQKLRFHILK